MTAYTLIDSADRNTGVDLTITGVVPTATDTFPPGPDVYLRVTTGVTNNLTCAVTWPTALDAYGVAKANLVLNGGVAIPVSNDRIFGPFPAAEFADPSDGQVHLANATTFTGTLMRVYKATNGT